MAADPSLAEQKSFAFFNMNQTEKCLNCLRNVCFVHSETGDMESETPGVMGHPDYAQSDQDQGQEKVAGVYRMREVIKVATIRSTEVTTPAAPASAHFKSLQLREAQSAAAATVHASPFANLHNGGSALFLTNVALHTHVSVLHSVLVFGVHVLGSPARQAPSTAPSTGSAPSAVFIISMEARTTVRNSFMVMFVQHSNNSGTGAIFSLCASDQHRDSQISDSHVLCVDTCLLYTSDAADE
eukprot:TRINITY_DN197_c0_g1_i6.p1 TRINITY_DN197_c0_g1~~TRINITY_DN197_c0_g1_i6.p1  ORF type:complete len:241 (-),score=44.23 TRINITY_DN197_c0_g1_i6:18-740(-)